MFHTWKLSFVLFHAAQDCNLFIYLFITQLCLNALLMQSQKQAMSQNELEIYSQRVMGLMSEQTEILKSMSHASWGFELLKEMINGLREGA